VEGRRKVNYVSLAAGYASGDRTTDVRNILSFDGCQILLGLELCGRGERCHPGVSGRGGSCDFTDYWEPKVDRNANRDGVFPVLKLLFDRLRAPADCSSTKVRINS